MTNINTTSLKKGMVFSAPLFFDDGKNMFLAEKSPIERFHLETIKRWKIKSLVTYGKEIDPSELLEKQEIEELEEL